MLTQRQKAFIKRSLLRDMPIDDIKFEFNEAAQNLSENDRFLKLTLQGFYNGDRVFKREEFVDLVNRVTGPGVMESSGARHGFSGMGIIYMRNLMHLLKDEYTFSTLNMQAGSHSGAIVWAKCGFVLDYPKTNDIEEIAKAKKSLLDLRDEIARRLLQSPIEYAAIDKDKILNALDKSIAQGYVAKEDENILWHVVDCDSDVWDLLGSLKYDMKLDIQDPVQIARLETYAQSKINLRTRTSEIESKRNMSAERRPKVA